MKETVLITGATKGIGLETTRKLTSLGYHVVGIARQQPDFDFSGDLFLTDLTSIEKTKSTLNKIINCFDISAVVNNLGGSSNQALGDIDLEVFNKIIDLNVRTTIQVTQACIGGMKLKRQGRIINMSSLAVYGQ